MNQTNANEQAASIQLLPRGAFVITRINGDQIKGRFSIIVLEQFCENKKIPNFLAAIEKITVGMTIGEYAELLRMSIDKSFTQKQMLDFIDEEFDGVNNDFIKLILHAAGRLGKAKQADQGEMDDSKKKEGDGSLTGMNSENSAFPQD